ncbi:transcription factor WhiB [Halopolyspora algeriensis]|uniref:Transcriptional regulator WhiB n=1 Tax=Halopolyspora algeriensis TaxID=1500506 RepID=A0A368VTQ6_9ACTN|nr:WhiB family transcriptional regulator [Halopolyspora algeriensis]RCW45135.1 transcription factor WhiB [Halopolyspora algeriensis]TQM53144.1 transcription factor WhiB [Halopolyspora algeriensis]
MPRRITHFQQDQLDRVARFADADGDRLQLRVADTAERNCRDVPTEVFFPATDEYSDQQARLTERLRIQQQCRGCPVADECLAGALLRGERFGGWGGVAQPDFQAIGRLFRTRHKRRQEEAA